MDRFEAAVVQATRYGRQIGVAMRTAPATAFDLHMAWETFAAQFSGPHTDPAKREEELAIWGAFVGGKHGN